MPRAMPSILVILGHARRLAEAMFGIDCVTFHRPRKRRYRAGIRRRCTGVMLLRHSQMRWRED